MIAIFDFTRERIFELFFTTKEMRRETGLALASAYGIVQGHRGFIEVESAPGRGTTFDLYLAASGQPVLEERAAAEAIGGRENILLVDDEEVIRHVGRDMLITPGYHVMLAS